MTTAAELVRTHGHLRYAREVKTGWWLRFAGTWDPDTGKTDFTPYWVEVATVEVLPMEEQDDGRRRRLITFTDGSSISPPAMSDVNALTARQAKAAGLGGTS